MVKLGSLLSGVVDRITEDTVFVCVNAGGFSMGKISVEHLADHHGIISFYLIKRFSLLCPPLNDGHGYFSCRASHSNEVSFETRI